MTNSFPSSSFFLFVLIYSAIRLSIDFEKRSIAEMAFVEGICKIAKKYIDFSKFETNLEKFLKNE